MKGFVATPEATVDAMVARLFKGSPPRQPSRLLDPGCGHGAFIEGVLRWCHHHNTTCPEIVGIELDPDKINVARKRLSAQSKVSLVRGDFLTIDLGYFDYIIGNPPYVPIYNLSEEERKRYRGLFKAARGRMDLYFLFWERALQLLSPSGRLVFITPEKFIYVETASNFRAILSSFQIEELVYAPEDTFPGLITYTTITTVVNEPRSNSTAIRTRDGKIMEIFLPCGPQSWQPEIHHNSFTRLNGALTLQDLRTRVSCGVATGADAIFVRESTKLSKELKRLSYPTLAGRELRLGQPLPEPRRRMLTPYDREGRLLPEEELDVLGAYLSRRENKTRLISRTCVQRKPWYAFHETPPLKEILRPKILSKDLTSEPYFWVDHGGRIVPRHSIYYVVPNTPEILEPLADFLNSKETRAWLHSHCHRAANGFLRIQSAILKKLPIPDDLMVALERRSAA